MMGGWGGLFGGGHLLEYGRLCEEIEYFKNLLTIPPCCQQSFFFFFLKIHLVNGRIPQTHTKKNPKTIGFSMHIHWTGLPVFQLHLLSSVHRTLIYCVN